MDTSVLVELGMEGRNELIALTGGHDMSIDLSKDLDTGRENPIDIRGTDEGHGNVFADALDWCLRVKAAQLASVGIALHVDVHRAQVQGRQEYQAGAGAEDGQAVDDCLADGLEESQFAKQFALCGRFATRDDQSAPSLRGTRVESLPIIELTNLDSLYTQAVEHLLVLDKCSL